jgi:hypothetical protein
MTVDSTREQADPGTVTDSLEAKIDARVFFTHCPACRVRDRPRPAGLDIPRRHLAQLSDMTLRSRIVQT